MLFVRALGVTFAILSFAAAFAFGGSMAVLYVLEHLPQ